jgi:hypothetical protein
MDWQVVLGWGSPIGLGFWFLGFGIFLWGVQFHPWRRWSRRKDEPKDM